MVTKKRININILFSLDEIIINNFNGSGTLNDIMENNNDFDYSCSYFTPNDKTKNKINLFLKENNLINLNSEETSILLNEKNYTIFIKEQK